MSLPFSVLYTVNEIDKGLSNTKSGKAGMDGIYPEFLKNLGPKAKKWLADFLSNIHSSGLIPKEWKVTKFIAILKPGKEITDPKSCWSIYEKLEQLLFQKLQLILEQLIPKEQARFRTSHNCCDQLLALTSYIEFSYRQKLKTAAVFIDLSSGYSVW